MFTKQATLNPCDDIFYDLEWKPTSPKIPHCTHPNLPLVIFHVYDIVSDRIISSIETKMVGSSHCLQWQHHDIMGHGH
jgi:hypothetical protein